MNRYILDGHGEPVPCDDLLTWVRWFEANDEARRIALTERDKVTVSTVFLGLNHAFMPGPPVLFETMVFGGEHDGFQERYTSRLSAEQGHQRIVQMVWP